MENKNGLVFQMEIHRRNDRKYNHSIVYSVLDICDMAYQSQKVRSNTCLH